MERTSSRESWQQQQKICFHHPPAFSAAVRDRGLVFHPRLHGVIGSVFKHDPRWRRAVTARVSWQTTGDARKEAELWRTLKQGHLEIIMIQGWKSHITPKKSTLSVFSIRLCVSESVHPWLHLLIMCKPAGAQINPLWCLKEHWSLCEASDHTPSQVLAPPSDSILFWAPSKHV